MHNPFEHKINQTKIQKKHANKKYLERKYFNQLNPNLISVKTDINDKFFYKNWTKEQKNKLVGTVVGSGFLWPGHLIAPNLWKCLPYKVNVAKLNKFESRRLKLPNSVKQYEHSNPAKFKKLAKPYKDKFFKKTNFKEGKRERAIFRMSPAGKSTVVIAPAGSGKTQGVVLPTVYANATSGRPSMVITDPKGEIYKGSYTHLIRQGYNVKVMNLFDNGQNTDCFSPFTETKKMLFRAFKYPASVEHESIKIKEKKINLINEISIEVNNVCESISNATEDDKNDFWETKGLDALNLIFWMIIDDLELKFRTKVDELKEERRKKLLNAKQKGNLSKEEFLKEERELDLSEEERWDIFDSMFLRLNFQSAIYLTGSISRESFITFYEEHFKLDIQKLDDVKIGMFQKEHPGIRSWTRTLSTAESMSESIISTLTKTLKIFHTPALTNMTIYNTFDLEELTGETDRPLALFIVLDSNQKATLGYVSWFINYIITWVSNYASRKDSGKLDKPLLFLLEELGNIPHIKSLKNLINEGRGRNLISTLIFQNFRQYQTLYPKGGLIKSAWTLMILTNREGEFQKEISRYAGTYIDPKAPHSKRVKERLSANDFYGIPLKRALIINTEENIPYMSTLVPMHFIANETIEKIEVKITTKSYKLNPYHMKLVYSPSNPEIDWEDEKWINVILTWKTREYSYFEIKNAYINLKNWPTQEMIIQEYPSLSYELIANFTDKFLELETIELKRIADEHTTEETKNAREDVIKSSKQIRVLQDNYGMTEMLIPDELWINFLPKQSLKSYRKLTIDLLHTDIGAIYNEYGKCSFKNLNKHYDKYVTKIVTLANKEEADGVKFINLFSHILHAKKEFTEYRFAKPWWKNEEIDNRIQSWMKHSARIGNIVEVPRIWEKIREIAITLEAKPNKKNAIKYLTHLKHNRKIISQSRIAAYTGLFEIPYEEFIDTKTSLLRGFRRSQMNGFDEKLGIMKVFEDLEIILSRIKK